MSYHYTDASREFEPTALPDVEIFCADWLNCDLCERMYVCPCGQGPAILCPHHGPVTTFPYPDIINGGREILGQCECGETIDDGTDAGKGYFYAFGFPGCLWDSDPVGPFDTEAEALQNARESAGF